MNAGTVRTYADWLVSFLTCACHEIEIAGSLRRGKADVKDIEIVVRPWRYIDLFGEELPGKTLLDTRLGELMETEAADWDSGNKKNGEKYKRFLMRDASDESISIPVDLFLADKDNYGNILAIRTGNAAFSKAFVTERFRGGLMPNGMCQRDGYLWRLNLPSDGIANELLPWPTEAAFFEALGIPLIDPQLRTEDTIMRLKRPANRH